MRNLWKTLIEKKVWEGLVVEWVEQKEDEELYIQLYDTKKALAWYRDVVVPQRNELEEKERCERLEEWEKGLKLFLSSRFDVHL